ncbi:EamA family transporter [Streptomyces lydicus]|uniref:EamA family transporter n=1 Tax=Streptomyces lydicus TaxID=47763 RepID=UPI00379CEBA7
MAVLERARAHAPRTSSARGAGLVLALTATVVRSGNFVIARALHDTVPLVQTSFWRWIIALLAVAPLALPQVRRQWPDIRRHLGYLALAALLSHLVLGEAVGPVQLVCTALIVVGVALGAGSRR